MATLAEISEFLKTLGLPTSKPPTVNEVRQRYRALLILHPDRAGPATTEEFQKITEAVRHILEFLQQNVQSDSEPSDNPAENEDDSILLSSMEKAGTLRQNKDNSITIILDDKDCHAWLTLLEKKLGPKKKLGDACTESFQVKTSEWKIPYVTAKTNMTYGSVSASIWIAPKSGTSKVRIQGSAGVAFVIFEVPKILRSVRTNTPELPEDQTAVLGDGVNVDGTPAIDTHGIVTKSAPPPLLPSTPSAGPSDAINPESLLEAFHRLEVRIVDFQKTMINKVDSLSARVHTSDDQSSKLASVQAAVTEQTKQLQEIKTNILQIVPDKNQITQINESLENLKKQNSEISQLTTQMMASCPKNETIVEVSNTVKEVKQQIKGVQSDVSHIKTGMKTQQESLTMQTDINNKNNTELVQIRKGIQTMVEQIIKGQNPTNIPSSIPDKTKKAGVDEVTNGDRHQTSPKSRKGLMFSSSIAKNIDKSKLEEELCCEIDIIPTYHVFENANARDPEKHLAKMTSDNMAANIDFVILSVGSNDISVMDMSKPRASLHNDAQAVVNKLIDLGEDLSLTYDCDVFINTLTPRYDDPADDPNRLRRALTEAANGLLIGRVMLYDRLKLVNQSRLSCPPGKLRNERFSQDGIHLSEKGLSLFANNIVSCVLDNYTDLQFSTRPPASDQRRRGGFGRRGGNSDGSDWSRNDWSRDQGDAANGTAGSGQEGDNRGGGGRGYFRGHLRPNRRQDGDGRGFRRQPGRDFHQPGPHDRNDRGRQYHHPRGGRGRGDADLMNALRSLVNQGYGGGYNGHF